MKRFTILIAAAVMLLAIMLQPTRLWGQERTGKAYVRITSLSELSNDSKIIFAIRYNSTATAYKAMGNTISGKISTTAFTSTTLGTYEIAPTSITNNINSYNWTVSISSSNYSFTDANGKQIGWSSGANFANGSGTKTWALSSYKTNNGGMVGGYTAWKILNTGSSNKRCFALNNSNPQTVGPYDISTNASSSSYNFAIDIFVEKDTYTLSYNGNNNDDGTAPSEITRVTGTSVTIDGNTGSLTRTGFTFGGWCLNSSGTGTIYGPDEGQTHAITLTDDVELYAKWIANSDYITVAPSPNNVPCASGSANFTTLTNIASPSFAVQFYTTSECNVISERPAWLGSPSFGDGTLSMSVSENTNSARSAYFKVYSGTTYSNVVTINQAAITVLPPTFNHGTGTYYENQSITLTNQTDGASIYYTMGANPDDPTSSSTPYSGAISVTSTTTIKAIAIKNGVSSSVVTATYTLPTVITVAEARAYVNTTDFFYTRGVVTYVVGDGKTAYIQDETAAIAIYKNDNTFTSGLSVGDDIVVNGKKTTYHGLVEVGTATIVTTLSTGNTVSPTVKTVTAINTDYGSGSGDNNFQSMFVKIEKATYNGSNSVTQSGSSITVEGTMGDAVNGDAVTFTGIIGCYDGVKIINLGNVEIVNDPTILAAESLTVPSYVQGTPVANITAGSLSVSGSNLSADITCTLDENSKFELYNGSEWTNTTTIAQTSGSASGSLQIRLKTGQSYNASAYTGSVTLSSTGVDDVVVSLSGSVTYATLTYDANEATTGTAPSALSTCTYGQEITLSGKGDLEKTGYNFGGWNTLANGEGTNYAGGATYTIYANTTLYAKWDAATYNLHTASMTNGSVSFTVGENAATTAKTGQTVTLVVTPSTNYGLTNLTVTNETTSETVPVTNNTFTMPASDIIVSATFKPVVTDELTLATTGISGGAGYGNWSGKTSNSDAVYAGRSAGGNNSIQLRDKKDTNTPGIVTTSTGGKVKKVSVSWNSNTTSGRYITIYGKTSAYSEYSDLYSNNSSTVGESLGTIVCGTSTELTVTGNYDYIGIKASDPLYLDQINITWAPPTYTVTYDANGGSGTMTDPDSPYTKDQTVTVLSNSFTAPDGKEFSRWNTAENGSGIYYNPGSTFEMPNSNVTLYAQWIDHCSVKATMDSDETSATCNYMQGEDRYEVDFTSKVKTLGGCDITEYGFVYSTTDETPTVGEDNCVKIEVGTSYSTAGVSFNTTIANATLDATYYVRSYAINNAGTAYSDAKSVAVPSSYPTYTISYSTNGNPDGSSTVNQGNAIGTLPTPTSSYIPAGYEFVGWYNGDSYGSATAPTLVKATDVPEGPMNLKAMFAISPTGGEQCYEITVDDLTGNNAYGTTHSFTKGTTTFNAYGVYKNNGIQMNTGKGTYIKNTNTLPGVITRFSLTWSSSSNNTVTMYANAGSEASDSSANLGTQSAGTSQSINDLVGSNYNYFYLDGTTVSGACVMTSLKIYYIDYYYTTSATVPSGEYWHVNGDGELTENTIIPAGTYTLTSRLTVPEGMILTINGYLGTTPENLVVEDGGQIITSNAVNATMQKKVKAATAKAATYWYAISSAVANPNISSATNLITETVAPYHYDLYRYNEAATATNDQGQILYWENYRASHADFTTLEKGRGYLYRNASDLSIAMTGEINVADFNYEVTKTGSGVLAGFNLIGNPYSHDIYKGDGTAIPNGTDFLRTGFYYMNPADGSWTPGTDGITAIKPNEGILVQTDKSDNIKMTNTNSNGAKYNNDNIMFKVANSQYSDETYAWFDKGRGLNKISHRNAEVPMIYINQDGEDYAIATMSDDTKMFSLNFKAMTMGKYTLSYKTKGEFNYLHVIDRFTGEDVDMLLEGEYSFVASPSDSDARFIVKLAYLPDYGDGEGDIFAYQNGSDIFVSGEGELQIFDVMGRFVMSERINGVKTISADELSKGVYVLRLVGNGMKTQKIVVK